MLIIVFFSSLHKCDQGQPQIERLSQDQSALYKKLYNVLETLTDLKYVLNRCSISDKEELL